MKDSTKRTIAVTAACFIAFGAWMDWYDNRPEQVAAREKAVQTRMANEAAERAAYLKKANEDFKTKTEFVCRQGFYQYQDKAATQTRWHQKTGYAYWDRKTVKVSSPYDAFNVNVKYNKKDDWYEKRTERKGFFVQEIIKEGEAPILRIERWNYYGDAGSNVTVFECI